MNVRKFRNVAIHVCYHALVFLKGLVKVLYGALMTGLIALAVYGFVAVPTEGGYVAVLDFVGAVGCLFLAIGGTYLIGGKRNKGGYER